MHPLEHQLAVFLRGDSAIVVAAYEWDSVAANARAEAALAIAFPGYAGLFLNRVTPARPRGTVVDTVAARPMVVSVEVLARDARRAARARYGVTPSAGRGGLVLSDLLLFRVGDSLPASLESVIPLALGSLRLERTDRLGIYWEVSGITPDDSLAVTLALEREGKSWLRKAVEWIGLANDRSPHTQLRWRETVPRGPPLLTRRMAVEVSDLEPGRYRLTVRVRDRDGGEVGASRVLTVQRPRDR